MSRVKLVIPCLLALFMLGAVGASAAWATGPVWLVEGGPLVPGAKEAIAESTTVTKAFSITVGPGEAVECPSVRFEEAYIEGEKTRQDKSMIIEGCKVVGAPGCTVGTIKSKPMTSTLEGTEGNYKLNFKPTSGTEVATVTTCVGPVVIKGTMACNYPGVESPAKNHVLEFTSTSGSMLTRGSFKVTFTGTDEFWLSSGRKWSVS